MRDLSVWTEVYWGSLGNQNTLDFSSNNEGSGLHNGTMSKFCCKLSVELLVSNKCFFVLVSLGKTRSYGDLISAGLTQNGISRRSSDPNMMVDAK